MNWQPCVTASPTTRQGTWQNASLFYI